MDPILSMIMLWSSPRIPYGWFPCDGRQLTISQYQALYAVIGYTFGGDGRTYFNLPDLRSRVPVGIGQGAGLSAYTLGLKGGAEGVTLTQAQLAAHTHAATAATALTGSVNLTASGTLAASKNPGSSDTPGANLFPAKAPDYVSQGLTADNIYGTTDGTTMPVNVTITPNPAPVSVTGGVTVAVQSTGNNMPHPNIQPFLGMQYIIAWQGLFPDFND